MSYVIFDVESKPKAELLDVFMESVSAPKNFKDEEKIKEYIEGKKADARKAMATDSDYCEVVCICIKEEDRDPVTMSLEQFALWLEKTEDVGGAQVSNKYKTFVGFNSRVFDIPVIIKAGLRAKLKMPYKELFSMLDKYKGQRHIDLMEKISMAWGSNKSLDTYLKIYLGEHKDTQGDEFFKNATDEELRAHCVADVLLTEKLYKFFEEIL